LKGCTKEFTNHPHDVTIPYQSTTREITRMAKYTEEEMQRVAQAMYQLMTARSSSVLDQWPAFKQAQAAVNPTNKYSTNTSNAKLLKELRLRVNKLFSDNAKKVKITEVSIEQQALIGAEKILTKLKVQNSAHTDHRAEAEKLFMKPVKAEMPKETVFRKLLTGNVVEEASEPQVITIVTKCPRKWVLVDLETGNQYSTGGAPVDNELIPRCKFEKATRKVSIPKAKIANKC
jgi:hypothetical protein